jgi:hypothetical protein
MTWQSPRLQLSFDNGKGVVVRMSILLVFAGILSGLSTPFLKPIISAAI